MIITLATISQICIMPSYMTCVHEFIDIIYYMYTLITTKPKKQAVLEASC